VPDPKKAALNKQLEAALAELAREYGMKVSALKGPRTGKALSKIRFEAYALLRGMGASYPQIGRLLGGRHHTTVMAGVRVFEKKERESEVVPQDNGRTLTVDRDRARQLGMVDDVWACARCGRHFGLTETALFNRAGQTFCTDVESCDVRRRARSEKAREGEENATWLVVWKVGPGSYDFMRDGDAEDVVSEFETEDEAEEAADATPAAKVWPYVVVEAPR
jgi:hypothetical protein